MDLLIAVQSTQSMKVQNTQILNLQCKKDNIMSKCMSYRLLNNEAITFCSLYQLGVKHQEIVAVRMRKLIPVG